MGLTSLSDSIIPGIGGNSNILSVILRGFLRGAHGDLTFFGSRRVGIF